MSIISGAIGASKSFSHLDIAYRAIEGMQALQKTPVNAGQGLNPLQKLIEQVRNSSSPLEQGALLRSLDNVSGGRGNADALVRGYAAPSQTSGGGTIVVMGSKYNEGSLYGAGGPSMNDIQQNSFGDCYFVATLGAVANENPNMIRNAIKYDEKSQSFNVTLYDAKGQPQVFNVTEKEIDANIGMGGGSRQDNGGFLTAPLWPDVMEVAYAKQLDSNHSDGLDEGYTDLANGGWPADAMQSITGSKGHAVQYDKGWFESYSHARDEVGNQIKDALANDKPVTAWTVPEKDSRGVFDKISGKAIPQDGLLDNHVYTVTSVYKDSKGDWQVVMRNPWGHNNLGTASEGKDTYSAFITVPLEKMINTGGLQSFRVGD